MVTFGRRVIYSDEDQITESNVVSVITDALTVHTSNSLETDYLYRYCRGEQPILSRVKEIRPEINNKIVINRALEIVTFKSGYLVGEPIQYVSRDGKNIDQIMQLNTYMSNGSKDSKDEQLSEWFYKCGTSYRMILPASDGYSDAPFEIYVLDPRYTFVVYSSSVSHKPLAGVTYVTHKDGKRTYYVYSEGMYYRVEEDKVVEVVPLVFREIPIIEYPANYDRLGAFEPVMTMLDAMNLTQSNRVDGVEQFIQALMLFKGVDITADDFNKLKELGAVKVPQDGDVRYLLAELNQGQVQTLMDDMYQTVLNICGMPNRNGGSSTSDTGTAVIYRDGWSAAEAQAKRVEPIFKESEKRFLTLAIELMNTQDNTQLELSDVEIKFTRRNYENIQEKAQVLTTMLDDGSIDPRLAFENCGMFADPEAAYNASKKYKDEQDKSTLSSLLAQQAAQTAQTGNVETQTDTEKSDTA